jgi:hypothetical protein
MVIGLKIWSLFNPDFESASYRIFFSITGPTCLPTALTWPCPSKRGSPFLFLFSTMALTLDLCQCLPCAPLPEQHTRWWEKGVYAVLPLFYWFTHNPPPCPPPPTPQPHPSTLITFFPLSSSPSFSLQELCAYPYAILSWIHCLQNFFACSGCFFSSCSMN